MFNVSRLSEVSGKNCHGDSPMEGNCHAGRAIRFTGHVTAVFPLGGPPSSVACPSPVETMLLLLSPEKRPRLPERPRT